MVLNENELLVEVDRDYLKYLHNFDSNVNPDLNRGVLVNLNEKLYVIPIIEEELTFADLPDEWTDSVEWWENGEARKGTLLYFRAIPVHEGMIRLIPHETR